MKRRAVLAGALWLVAARAGAQSFIRVGIAVERPWAKPSVTDAAAIIMTLRNDGPRADRLLGGATPIAARVILREIDGSPLEFMDLEPRRPMLLRPGRRYIALRGLTRLLAVDDTFPLRLMFAEAGALDLTVRVAEGMDERMSEAESD
jgi:copper(I)-binding protein